MADQVCILKSRAISARWPDEMIVYPQLMLLSHSLPGVSVVCFDASDWGQSPAPALRALSERSRSQLRGRSQSPSHQSVSSGQWRGRGDIMCDASHVWLDICLAVQRKSIRNCIIPLMKGCHLLFDSWTLWSLMYQSDIDSLRMCFTSWKNWLKSECESELEILDLAPEIGFLRFMVSVYPSRK